MSYVEIPMFDIPQFRVERAFDLGVQDSLLFLVGGGLGDHVCAEPVIRYATKFPGKTVAVASLYPQCFDHLVLEWNRKLDSALDIKPLLDEHLVLRTMEFDAAIGAQFVSQFWMNGVDYASVSALRATLPPADKTLSVSTNFTKVQPTFHEIRDSVIVHVEAEMKAKAIPSMFWNQLISSLNKKGITPVLTGKLQPNLLAQMVGSQLSFTDLRGLTTLPDLFWIISQARALITTDSAPLHIAASSCAKIAYISTMKRPDLLLHWRKVPGRNSQPVFGWRMKNFSRGGIWQQWTECPSKPGQVNVANEEVKWEWLMAPEAVVEWALSPGDA